MDTTTLLIIAGIALLLIAFFMRNRVQPRGTYDDPNTRSSGSIGGGTRAYDDPDYKSGGSIGGSTSHRRSTKPAATAERPSHDDKDFKSGGSIGG